MPKLKSNRSACKRFKVTKTGKFRRYHSGKRHLLSSMSAKRKRNLRQSAIVTPADHKRVSRLLSLS
jgi:large subunit ribosomal protein L35